MADQESMPVTNEQLYELFQALNHRVEDMDADHSAKIRKLERQQRSE